jgi:thiol-disulfide isomerase/thioredoxin
MKNSILSLLALCGALALPIAAQDKKPDAKPEAASAQKAPEAYKLGATVDENITLKDIDGKELKLKDLKGKVVFIHFWSMTCPYEIVADPKVQALEKAWAGKDVVVLAINANKTEIGEVPPSDASAYDKIREHLKEKKMAMRVFADHGNKVADLFGARSTPHCYVINQKGVLVYAGGLDDDPKGDKGEATQQFVRDAVEATLAGKEVKVKDSKPYGCSIKRVAVGGA